MPLRPADLRAQIKTVLTPLGLYSADAEELLMATCAQESLLGTYRRQGGGGPALGIFQMEPEDFYDIFKNFLAYRERLNDEVGALATTQPPRPSDLVNNDALAIALCRVQYERAPGALPSATDLNGLWSYYKKYYNTPEGAATQEEFVKNYKLTGGSAC